MPYEKVSASNSHSVTLTLSRPMAEFLFQILSSEIKDDSAAERYNGKKLRRICDGLWQFLKPTPLQQKRKMQAWVNSLYSGRSDISIWAEHQKRAVEAKNQLSGVM